MQLIDKTPKKSDLGPYAHEDRMPDWLRLQLETGGKAITVRKIDPATGRLMNVVQIAHETPDLIPTIALLSERDPEIVRTYLCHPGTKHVGKQISKEGGFCGYRNIQMLISHIQAAFPRGSHPFEGRIPTILKMQDLIEEGWAKGINSTARLETGGIKGTRKYIGTSEVCCSPVRNPIVLADQKPRRKHSSPASASAPVPVPSSNPPTRPPHKRKRRSSPSSRTISRPTSRRTPPAASKWSAPTRRPSTSSTAGTR
jgi:hypothetical protein